MPALRSIVQLSAIIAIVTIAAPAAAQDWPAGTTRIVVPYAAGGPVDFPARLLIDRRNVTLRVALKDGEARVEVRNGEVQAAECGGHTGFNALVRIGRAATGIFWLSENDAPLGRSIGERPDRLLSLLARCLDPVASR